MARNEIPQQMLRYTAVGIEFITVFGVGVAAGMYVDRRDGGGFLWTLLGAASGFAVGIYLLFRAAREYRRSLDRKDVP